MIWVMFAVKDSAIDAFNRPFCAHTTATAIRSFTDEVNRQGSEMNSHPEDYSLHDLGTWDDGNGKFTQDGVRCVVRGQDVFKGKG